MARTEAAKRAEYKYRQAKVKRVPLDIKIVDYEILKEYTDKNNLTVNGFIKDLIKKELQKDNINIF